MSRFTISFILIITLVMALMYFGEAESAQAYEPPAWGSLVAAGVCIVAGFCIYYFWW